MGWWQRVARMSDLVHVPIHLPVRPDNLGLTLMLGFPAGFGVNHQPVLAGSEEPRKQSVNRPRASGKGEWVSASHGAHHNPTPQSTCAQDS